MEGALLDEGFNDIRSEEAEEEAVNTELHWWSKDKKIFFFLFHTKNLINTEGKVTFTNCTQNVCVCNKKQNEKNMDEL